MASNDIAKQPFAETATGGPDVTGKAWQDTRIGLPFSGFLADDQQDGRLDLFNGHSNIGTHTTRSGSGKGPVKPD